MKKRFAFCLLALATLHSACSKSSGPEATADGQPVAAQTARVHFFSVAWGCVEVEKSKLDAASYTIKDFATKTGACPETLPVLTSTSKPLLNCPVVIGPKLIPATYILFDKRSLDGKTVSDLSAEGFTTENFCPALAARTFN
jgi:hypothetical protein